MENLFYETVKLINPVQLILIGLIVFYFYNRLDQKFEKRFDKIDERFDKVDEKFDKVDEKFDKVQQNFKQDFKEINQRFDNLYTLVINLIRKDAA